MSCKERRPQYFIANSKNIVGLCRDQIQFSIVHPMIPRSRLILAADSAGSLNISNI